MPLWELGEWNVPTGDKRRHSLLTERIRQDVPDLFVHQQAAVPADWASAEGEAASALAYLAQAGGGGIGEELGHLRSMLLGVGAELTDLLSGPMATALGDVMADLRATPVRVAVIGQVKAGKTTLVNTLIGRSDLLPTHVNPWTSAVTRLHFGHPGASPGTATFEFLSEDEWDQLTNGGGPLRVVTDRLLPNFDADIFRSQLMAIRTRAHKRLGDGFDRLLGHQHHFDGVSPEVIARYVCAGEDEDGQTGTDMAPGQFSDLTKCGDIYLGQEPFSVPLTITDTPGTNDPFLLRDEITLRSLEDADVCILVLSAHQALTTADVALLRVVQGLHKERVVIFINRLDEIDDFERDGPAIAAHVRALVEREFGVAMPVILGSGWWARQALDIDIGHQALLEDRRLANYAASVGGASKDEIEGWLQDPAQAPPERASWALYAASGLPALGEALSRLFARSGLADRLRAAATTLLTVAAQEEAMAKSDLESTETAIKQAHHDAMAGSWEMNRLRGGIAKLDALLGKLQRVASEREGELKQLQDAGVARLRQALCENVTAFAEAERNAFVLDADTAASSTRARFDIVRLRRRLEQTFIATYRDIYQGIVDAQGRATQRLRQVLSDDLPSTNIDVQLEVVSSSFVYPKMTALSHVGAFDIDPKLWTRWRKSQPSLKAAALEFQRILTTEFTTIAEELTRAASEHIGERVAALNRHLTLTGMEVVNTLRSRKNELIERLHELQEINEPFRADSFLEDQLRRLTDMRDRVARLDRLMRLLLDLQGATTAEPQALHA